MIPLTNQDSSEGDQWGRDEIYPDYIPLNPIDWRSYHDKNTR